ncbi:AEC family transporter [Polycladidibacter stylochi]|uniref:AEC family transporter n=1 Tax=Polycladidibacter stylochi TaxID=1807766 RepID=UPI00083778DC|nr:AEC family transporter [Pseudovibrio stylochi]
MIDAFINAIAPIFSVVVIGYILGKKKIFDAEAVNTINRLVFYALLPPFFLGLSGQAPFHDFEPLYLLAYFSVSLLINASVALVSYKLFKRDLRESILLGFMAGFVNHTFFILPVAKVIYGANAILPVTAVIAVDMMIMYGATVIIMDCASKSSTSASRADKVKHIAKTIGTNPHSLSLIAGLVLNIAGVSFDNGLGVFTGFLGSAAAPCSLFALGLFLSGQKLTGNVGLVSFISTMKLLVMPILALISFTMVFKLAPNWEGPGMFVAAGPCGTLPFILAIQYKVRVDTISQVLLITTFACNITLSLVILFQAM